MLSVQRQRFLFAVDPSLTCSGWALFAIADGAPLAAGIVTTRGPEAQLADRLAELQTEIAQLFSHLRMGRSDILVCEAPAPLVLNPNSALKVEQVRSIFESLARDRGVLVPGRINPRTVQTELLGLKGQQLHRSAVKDVARAVAEQLFGSELTAIPLYGQAKQLKRVPQDIIDALLLGTVAMSRLRLAEQSNRSFSEAFLPKNEGQGLARTRRALRWSEDDLQVAERRK